MAFNDVDLCLRIRERGYSIIYTPYAKLLHHESVSRGYKGDPAEVLYKRLGGSAGQRPYYNPIFSMGSGDFNLRADMLRPSPAAGDRATARRPRNLVQECVECPREKLLAYIEAHQDLARNSYRTGLYRAETRT